MSQNINLPAILYTPWARFVDKSLAVPHFSVRTLAEIRPRKLRDAGFKGLVFDKDNTLTAPYKNEIHPNIKHAFDVYRSIFGDRMVIVSNSAGTRDDRNYEDAKAIERDLGIKVIRHIWKKPAGIDPVLDYFKCKPSELVMFGDRVFTDVVFGNRYGMLTVHTAFLTEEGDNKTAAKIRRYEVPLIKRLRSEGISAPEHDRFDPAFEIDYVENGSIQHS